MALPNLTTDTPDILDRLFAVIRKNIDMFFVIIPIGVIITVLFNTVRHMKLDEIQQLHGSLFKFGIVIPAIIITIYSAVRFLVFLAKIFILPKIDEAEKNSICSIRFGRPHNDQIDNVLQNIAKATRADRACIIEFHNGDAYDIGENHKFDKASQNYEWDSDLVQNTRSRLQNIPLPYLMIFTDTLLSKGKNVFENPKKLEKNNPAIFEILVSQGIDSYYAVPIYGTQKKLMGWVSLHYISSKCKLCKTEWQLLKSSAEDIGKIFSHWDKYKKYE